MRNYRVAVIGRTGRGNYGHGLDIVWKEFPNTRIVAVADENEAGAKSAGARLGTPAVYTDYNRMLREERPDIVSVAPRWVDCHHDMALACAEAHASIFLEKPMARSLAEADAMLAACERTHMKLTIAHQMRLSPAVLDLRDHIRRGEIGRLLEIRARGKEDARAGGEDLIVLGTHAFDLMRLMAGDPLWCFAHVTSGGRDITRTDTREGTEPLGPLAGDGVAAVYAFPNRVHGYFGSELNDDKSGSRWGLEFRGSRGLMLLRAGMDPPVWILRANDWTPERTAWERLPVAESAGIGQSAANARLAADLMDAIEKDRQPLSSGYDGRWSLEMILGVYASQRAGGRVALPLKDRRHPLTA